MALGVEWGEYFEDKRQTRSGEDGLGASVQLRGAWVVREGPAALGLWLLALAPASLPSPVMSGPPDGSREERHSWGQQQRPPLHADGTGGSRD